MKPVFVVGFVYFDDDGGSLVWKWFIVEGVYCGAGRFGSGKK